MTDQSPRPGDFLDWIDNDPELRAKGQEIDPNWKPKRRAEPPRNGHATTHTVAPAGNEPYASAAMESELAGLATAASGTRNHTLNCTGVRLGRLLPSDAREYLRARLID